MENKENLEVEVKKTNSPSLASAVIVAAVLISGTILFSNVDKKEKIAEGNRIPIDPVSSEDFIRGDESATITLVEYSDFSCGFCGKHHPTLKKIVENYNGKVGWVYRHLPIFNEPAAIASQCVGNIGGNEKFWEYSDILMNNQKLINQDFLKEKAILLGLDGEKYESCINDPAVSNKISKDFNKTRILAGFNATPYNVLIDSNGNMYPFSGAVSYEELSAIIDSVI